MQKSLLLFAVTILLFVLPSASIAGKAAGSVKPSATLQKVWIDYDVKVNGVNGMRIHAAFTTYEMKGLDSLLRFTVLDEDGEALEGVGDRELVEAAVELKPGFDTAEFKDLSTFIAYDELNLEDGQYKLQIDVDVTYPDGDLISHLKLHEFEYTQKSPKPEADVELAGKSVEYGVTRDGRKGMLLHVTLDQLKGMKGVSGAVQVRIQDSKENFILGDTQEFSSPDGVFQSRFPIKPAYDPAKFDDIQIFIPYSEITIGKGKHNLKLDIDLIFSDGQLIKHLAFHEFEFSR